MDHTRLDYIVDGSGQGFACQGHTVPSHALNISHSSTPASKAMLSHTWLDKHATNGKCRHAAIAAVVRRDDSRVQPSVSFKRFVTWGGVHSGWRIGVSTRTQCPPSDGVGL